MSITFETFNKLEIERAADGGLLLTQHDSHGEEDSIYIPGWALDAVLAEVRKVAAGAE